jgi:hypothetical protein
LEMEDDNGKTSLSIAAEANNEKAVDILLKSGASPTLGQRPALLVSLEKRDKEMFKKFVDALPPLQPQQQQQQGQQQQQQQAVGAPPPSPSAPKISEVAISLGVKWLSTALSISPEKIIVTKPVSLKGASSPDPFEDLQGNIHVTTFLHYYFSNNN